MTDLLIVESPNKTKKIKKFLNEIGYSQIEVMASVGHIRDLPANDLGVDLNSFKPTYYVSDDKKAVVSKLKNGVSAAETVYLATDPDREGESIAWHLFETLNLLSLNKRVYRIKFNEINKKAIQLAFENKSQIDMYLVAAQEARRVLDRLVGYLVSPRLGNKLSAGRVQSPAVRLIVDREQEIEQFVPVTHYDVKASILSNETWSCLWHHDPYRTDPYPKKNYWQDIAIAQVVATVNQLEVISVDKKQRFAKAPAPFTTSSLQQAASNALRFSPDETMDLAQNLFAQGAITYHRTDSPNLSDEAIENVRLALRKIGLPCTETPNKWTAKAGAQEAHEAIRPVHCDESVAGETEKEQALYQLILKRTLACQMPDAVFNVTLIGLRGNVLVPIDQNPAIFRAKGEILTQEKGWMALIEKPQEQEDDLDYQALPDVFVGQQLNCKGDVLTKKTTPPNRYTEASLIKKLESLEIGRPSTYAAILKNIKNRDYILVNSKRQLEPTPKGKGLMSILKDVPFSFIEYDWTKHIENRLDNISVGKDRYGAVVSSIYEVLYNELKGLPEPSQFQRETVNGWQCQCGGQIESSDKAYQCTQCKSTVWKIMSARQISEAEAQKLFSGESIFLSGFLSKAKKSFDANCQIIDGAVKFSFEESQGHSNTYNDSSSSGATSSTNITAKCRCGGTIKATPKTWTCESCQATVWAVMSDRKIKQEEAFKLLAGESLELIGFTSKSSGKKFNAVVYMDEGKAKFQFN